MSVFSPEERGSGLYIETERTRTFFRLSTIMQTQNVHMSIDQPQWKLQAFVFRHPPHVFPLISILRGLWFWEPSPPNNYSVPSTVVGVARVDA